MALLDLIQKRQSVRRYSNRPVEREKIQLCLEAARLAPSACNGQPWRFIVADDPKLKDTLCDQAFSGMYSMNKFVKEAPVVIAVVSEKDKFLAKIGGTYRKTEYYLIDIGIACEHFILQAHELGLGTCWIGWFDEAKVKQVLGIPKNKKVDTLLSLGYPGNEIQREKKRESLEAMSSFNQY